MRRSRFRQASRLTMFAFQGMCEGCGAQSSDLSSAGFCPDCQSDLYESEHREAVIRPEATIDLWNLKTAVDEQISMGACTKCGDLYAPESFDEGLCPECEYARDWFDDQAIEGRHEGSITNLRKDSDDYTATCECGNTLYCDPPEYYDDDPYGIWYACSQCGLDGWLGEGEFKTASRKTAVNDIYAVDCLDCGWSTSDSDTINTADYKNECPDCGSDDLEFLALSNNGVTLVPTERRLAQRHEGHRRTALIESETHSNGVVELFADDEAELDGMPGVAICGHCGRAWVDSIITSVTPSPGGRCPFEYEHTGRRRKKAGYEPSPYDGTYSEAKRKTASGDWSYYEGNGYSTWSKNAGSYILQVDGYNDGTYNWKCDPLLRQGAPPREYGDGLNGVTRSLEEAQNAAEQAVSGRTARRRKTASPVKFPSKCKVCGDSISVGQGDVRKVDGAWYTTCDAHKPAPSSYSPRRITMTNGFTTIQVDPDDVYDAKRDGFWQV